jgi:hypothetical protein
MGVGWCECKQDRSRSQDLYFISIWVKKRRRHKTKTKMFGGEYDSVELTSGSESDSMETTGDALDTAF